MSNKKIPKIIEEVGFGFDWDENKVWNLNIAVEEMPISDLVWHFDIPFWNFLDKNYNLSPNEVILNPKKYKTEFNRTMNADLSYPIDIYI